jgi:hypothetical protein
MGRKVKYKAQALAIAMVVLVVSSLIAMSVYSRAMKDKGLTLEERASSEALEVSDVLIDKLTQFPMDNVINEILAMELVGMDMSYPYSTGIVLKENNNGDSNITDLFRSESLQILDESQTLSDLLDPLCPIEKGGEYQITLKEADEDTYYEVKPGHIWSLPAKNLITQDECNVDIKLAIRGDTRAGFTLMKIYCSYDEGGNVVDCKEYEYDDIENYCFSDDGVDCNNVNFGDYDNWIKYKPNEGGGEGNIINIHLPSSEGGEDPGEYILSEIRIKSVGGTIGVSYILPEQCLTGLRMFQLRATANCSGVYRGKELLIPEQKWHNTIFDYVIFNGEGSL